MKTGFEVLCEKDHGVRGEGHLTLASVLNAVYPEIKFDASTVPFDFIAAAEHTTVCTCDLSALPLYVKDENEFVQAIAKWRLKVGM